MRLSFAMLVMLAAHSASTIAAPIDPATARLVDLTHAFNERTLYWPTSPSAFEFKSLAHGQTEGGYFYAANAFCAPEHGGTHLDAPIHFAERGRTADQIPLQDLVGPAVVIDVREQVAKDADYALTPDDVRAFESRHGEIAPGSIVLLRTGYGSRWPDRKAYFGDDTPNDASQLHFPAVARFPGTPDRRREERARSRKPRSARSAAADRCHRHCAADEDRRRLGRAGAGDRVAAERRRLIAVRARPASTRSRLRTVDRHRR